MPLRPIFLPTLAPLVECYSTIVNDQDVMDDALLARWRSGERRAGEQLFQRHYQRVERFFVNKVSDPGDLTQRTFLAFLESVDRYRVGHSVRAYLLGIAWNVLRNHFHRLQARASSLPLETSSIRDLGQTPSEMVAIDQDKQRVRLALQRLPVEQQTALELYIWEELTMREIADVLGWPEGTVKDRLRRAKLRLGELIEDLRPRPTPS